METIAELKKIKEALEVLINESEKPKFEVKKWYNIKYARGNALINYQTDEGDSYGFSFNGNYSNSFSVYGYEKPINYTLATPSEVQEALKKEIYKQIPINTYFTCLATGTKRILNDLDFDHFYNHNIIYNQNGYQIFKDGIFAQPIKTKTIENIAKDLSDLHTDEKIEYLTENKQTIIETLNNL